jgi:hypothetical protein
MTTPTITLYPDTIPAKGQAQAAFDTNVDNFLTWQTATNGPELNTFITWTVGVRDNVLATALAGDLPPLTGKALNFIRANATEDGGEFRTPAQVLSDIGATAALALKAPLAGPTFTGVPAAPTASAGTNTTQVATTAFAKNVAESTDLGVAQTWQDMSSSRASDLTVYQNITGKPIQVNIMYGGDFNSAYFEVSVDNSTWVRAYADSGDSSPVPMTGVVIPDDHYYRSSTTGGTADPDWFELR